MAKLKTGRHTSGIKELRKNKRRYKFNKKFKETARDLAKQMKKAVKTANKEEAKKLLIDAISKYDKAVKHNIFHKNMVNHKKSQLMKLINTLK
ncbi:MAG: hypothetical protein A2252_03530 [Elusimicrobia bacterium RIFOXYA2_FULL_39_19]|nr:MAG: hypothetical protein A2252_03530 [Elusimicrobia bacterium RIFOXYA2_FULL_39_19]